MPDDILKKVSIYLLSVPPLLYRKTRRKITLPSVEELDRYITRLHIEILLLLRDEGTLRVTETGKRLQIAKAHMTQLVNTLVDLNLVSRETDLTDRRAINITLTQKGKKFIASRENIMLNHIQEIISTLTDQELEELYGSLKTMHDILSKIP